ncbi:MAG: KamA family radical SAM protein [Candidatus Latescibacterota bacterium]|nr:MAG: KamA family radical SAM protein [Candidatus Latescibacterota bacterium]
MLWEANPELHEILGRGTSLEQARDSVFAYLERNERAVFNPDNPFHILEKATVRDCIRVFKSIIGPINEKRAEFSALECLWKLASGRREELPTEVSVGFLMEFIHLFRGVAGKSNLYREKEEVRRGIPDFLRLDGRKAALARSDMLDEMGGTLWKYFKRYPSGLDAEVVTWRKRNRRRILKYFGASAKDWRDYRWHLKNVIRSPDVVFDLIDMAPERRAAMKKALTARLPFGITPYYLSLMDQNPAIGYDHAVRAQVLPPPKYVEQVARHRKDRGVHLDFMGEHATSPIDLVTRRYPLICILKPYNTCAQVCVYCQRNWELDEVLSPHAQAGWNEIEKAIEWIAGQQSLGDVLITGGDPGIMNDTMVEKIFSRLAEIDHVYRIRFGTRTPVTVPFRFTDDFCKLLARYHEPGRREVAVVTHFEHSYEITPEARDAIQRIRRQCIGVYNQCVFTVENSRRFETAKLRRDLRLIGVDPYYTFNMKGKKETGDYMVPIARILQERKEEARLLPGLDRTDEPVFNVPRMGKNHLRAMQDRRLVMILADGSRVYEFHPWEKNILPMPPYDYVDVPIYEYLEELAVRGEKVRDYRTIWYYY